MSRRWPVLFVCVLAACGGTPQAEQPAAPSAQPTVEASAPDQEQTMAPDELMAALTADLADRVGVDPAAVEVRSAERVTWPNGALGCAEPGQTYTQALVDGYHVILTAAGADYDYRAPDRGPFKLCEQPGPDAANVDPQPFPDRPAPIEASS